MGLLGIYLILLFPDGKLPSKRWRPLAWFSGLVIVLLSVAGGFAPGPLENQGGVRNPFGLEALPWLQDAFYLILPLLLLCIFASAVSMVLRYRRSRGEVRQQIKWVAFVASFSGLLYLIPMVLASIVQLRSDDGLPQLPWWAEVFFAVAVLGFAGVPVAIGFAVLIYRAATLEQDMEAVSDLGGIARQYLNHHHEASPACDWVASTFHAPLHVHEADARAVSEVCNVDETFSERHKLDEDFEIIPIPGHTSGATAFLWNTGQHRALFTGDTIFFIRGRWTATVLDGVSDRERYIESLELIRTLDFDLVVPGIAPAGELYYELVEKPEAENRIDEILERPRRGESG